MGMQVVSVGDTFAVGTVQISLATVKSGEVILKFPRGQVTLSPDGDAKIIQSGEERVRIGYTGPQGTVHAFMFEKLPRKKNKHRTERRRRILGLGHSSKMLETALAD